MKAETTISSSANEASVATNLAALANIHLAASSVDGRVEGLSSGQLKFDPADLYYSLLDLHHLTEQVREILSGMDYGEGEGRNHELDRVAALCRVVSNQVEQLADQASVFDNPGGEWRSPS